MFMRLVRIVEGFGCIYPAEGNAILLSAHFANSFMSLVEFFNFEYLIFKSYDVDFIGDVLWECFQLCDF